MRPYFDERLASIIRALSEVVLPHLPPEASLAQEQVHLTLGHLQIMRAQLDQLHDYEREELADYVTLATALCSAVTGGQKTRSALAELTQSVSSSASQDVRAARKAVNQAVDGLVKACAIDGAPGAHETLSGLILTHEHARIQKDRKWFAPFGFDTL